jgi:hypothetical protein
MVLVIAVPLQQTAGNISVVFNEKKFSKTFYMQNSVEDPKA